MPALSPVDTDSHAAEASSLRREVRDVEASRDDWDAIHGALGAPSFFHRWEWLRAVSDHLVADVSCHWFFDGDRPVAVFPLEEAGGNALFKELRTPAHADIYLRDCLIAASHVDLDWAAVLGEALDGTAAVRLHRVPERSCAMRVFTDDASTVRISDNSMRVYCAVTSPEDLKSLSSKNLRNVARLARKAEREGGSVERTTYAGDEAHATGLDIFVKVEEASWKGPQGSGTSLSCDPRALGFYRDALRHFAGAADADARVEILTIGDQPAAGIVALRSGSQWNMLKVGYDERFSPFGPGGILLKLFLEEMVEDPGVNEVSLVTAPPWAGRWHLQEEPTRDIAVFMPSLAGRARSLRHDLVKAARGARASLERSNDA